MLFAPEKFWIQRKVSKREPEALEENRENIEMFRVTLESIRKEWEGGSGSFGTSQNVPKGIVGLSLGKSQVAQPYMGH